MVESLRAVLVCGVVCGCFVPGPSPVVVEVVVGRLAWLDPNKVPWEYRHVATTPLLGPYYVLVSLSGHYCVVPDVVYVARAGQRALGLRLATTAAGRRQERAAGCGGYTVTSDPGMKIADTGLASLRNRQSAPYRNPKSTR